MTAANKMAAPPKLWGWQTFASIGITLAILILLATKMDQRQVWIEVRKCNLLLVIIAALAHYATYPVRGMRWRCGLQHLSLTCGRRHLGLLVFFYNAVDNVVPAKLGDVYGAHLVRINCGVSRSAALGSLALLRMVDVWVVLFLALAGVWGIFGQNFPKEVVWVLGGGSLLAFGASSVLIGFALLKRAVPTWLPETVQRMVRDFQGSMWPAAGQWPPILFYTGLIWVLETLWIYLLLLSFGIEPELAEILFVTMVPLLASAVPITPSGAGLVEITLFSCLRGVGIAAPLAASVTVVNRLFDYWLHLLLGALTWLLRRRIGLRSYREAASQATVPREDASADKVS